MQIPALQQEAVIRALGWTFLHSLWQGLLLAVLAGLVILLTKNARAGLRYNLLVALVGLFLCAAGGTFVNGLRKATAAATAASVAENSFTPGYPVNNVLLPVFTNPPVQVARPRLVDRFTDYFNANASLVVIIWFIIFSAKLVKLMANIGYIQRIRYHKTVAPPGYWKEKIKQLADGLQIRRHVQLLQSGIVQVPVVIGTLKPVILIPLGILSQLPAGQVEAILLHELAHIKRRDYLVNLLQCIAETIFFFNPAVLWVSSLVRDERENCCDDVAVAGTKNKAAFVDALVSFQEYSMSVSKYGMAFPGRKNHLLNRVKRILHEKNKTLNTMEKSLLTFSTAVILLLTLTTARQVQAQQTPKPPAAPAKKTVTPVPAIAPPPVVIVKPAAAAKPVVEPPMPPAPVPEAAVAPVPEVASTPKPEINELPAVAPIPPVAPMVMADTVEPVKKEFSRISSTITSDGQTKTELLEATDRDGKTYKLNKLNGVITNLSVNGVEIDKEHYPDYQPVLDKIARHQDDNQKRNPIIRKSQQLRIDSKERQEERRKKVDEKKWVMQQQLLQKQQESVKKVIIINQKKPVPANDIVLKYDVVLKQGLVINDLKPTSYQPVKIDLLVNKPVARKPGRLFISKKPLLLRDRNTGVNDEEELQYQKNLLHALTADLVKDGIIKNEKKLESLGLNDTQLIVNDKKLPDDIQQKYRARYITQPGFGLYYGPVRMTGKGYFLGKEDF